MSFKEMCRTCLQAGSVMCSLFDGNAHQIESGTRTVADLLKLFTNIQINANDGFPDHICVSCLAEMNQAFSFKLKCIKSDAILKQLTVHEINLNKQQDMLLGFSNSNENRFRTENISSIRILPKPIYMKKENGDDQSLQIDLTKEESSQHNQTVHKSFCDIERIVDDKYSCETIEKTIPSRFHPYMQANTINDSQQNSEEDNYNPSSVKEEPELNIPVEVVMDYLDSDDDSQSEVNNQNTDNDFHSINNYQNSIKFHNPVEMDMQKFLAQKFRFQCSICTRNLKSKTEFDSHMLAHSKRACFCGTCATCKPEKNVFKCEVCSKVLRAKRIYEDHMRSHTGETPFKCPICTKTFRNKAILNYHLKIVHDPIAESMNDGSGGTATSSAGGTVQRCDICSKIFLKRFQLEEHKRIHTGAIPLKCDVCCTRFRYKHSLQRHMRVQHSGEGKKKRGRKL